MTTDERISRQIRIDLASAASAGILGTGTGVLLKSLLAPYGSVLVMIGIALHGWAMLAKRRFESNIRLQLWSTILYWTCWIALAVLAAWLGLLLIRQAI